MTEIEYTQIWENASLFERLFSPEKIEEQAYEERTHNEEIISAIHECDERRETTECEIASEGESRLFVARE